MSFICSYDVRSPWTWLWICCSVSDVVFFFPQAKVTEECSQYEFENYMRQQLLLAEEKNTLHEAKGFLQKRQFGNIPPVRRLGHDAQPMNPLDAAILAQRYLRK